MLAFYPALVADTAVWAVWSPVAAWWASRLSEESLAVDGWLTRLRPWERSGAAWTRLGVRRWKGHLPDLGRVWGRPARWLERPLDPAGWARMAAETRRAERAHWVMLMALPVEVCLRGGVVLAPMVAVAVVANAPCIVAQRYNRGRLLVLAARRGALAPGGPLVAEAGG